MKFGFIIRKGKKWNVTYDSLTRKKKQRFLSFYNQQFIFNDSIHFNKSPFFNGVIFYENNIQLLEKYENTTRETKIKGLKL
jgi:hypothetical protein